MRVMHKAVW